MYDQCGSDVIYSSSRLSGKSLTDFMCLIRNSFTMETKRQLDVLDRHLGGKDRGDKEREWICGDEYTIADMAVAPWIGALKTHYGEGKGAKFLGLDVGYPHVNRWYAAFLKRPAVKRGLLVNCFLAGQGIGIRERHQKSDFAPEMYID